MMASPTKFALLCGLLAMFCFGVYDVLKNYEDNACEMTYMFEMPEYMVSKADDRRTIKSASHVGVGNYGNWTFRPLAVSPPRRFAPCLDVSPPGRFAP